MAYFNALTLDTVSIVFINQPRSFFWFKMQLFCAVSAAVFMCHTSHSAPQTNHNATRGGMNFVTLSGASCASLENIPHDRHYYELIMLSASPSVLMFHLRKYWKDFH